MAQSRPQRGAKSPWFTRPSGTNRHLALNRDEERNPQKGRLLSDWNWTQSIAARREQSLWFSSQPSSFCILLCEEWRAKIDKSALGSRRLTRSGALWSFMSCGHGQDGAEGGLRKLKRRRRTGGARRFLATGSDWPLDSKSTLQWLSLEAKMVLTWWKPRSLVCQTTHHTAQPSSQGLFWSFYKVKGSGCNYRVQQKNSVLIDL